jgi:hypothetical protein
VKISQKEVCKVAGITIRQLQYWDSRGYIKGLEMVGGRRRIGLMDLFMYVAISRLRDLGFSIQHISKEYVVFLSEVIYGDPTSNIGEWRRVPDFEAGSSLMIDCYDNLIVNSGNIKSSHDLKVVMDFNETLSEIVNLQSKKHDNKSSESSEASQEDVGTEVDDNHQASSAGDDENQIDTSEPLVTSDEPIVSCISTDAQTKSTDVQATPADV